MLFQMVLTARDMGVTLEEFMSLSDDEKAIQIVISNILSKMEKVNAQDREDKMKRNSKK